VLCVVDVEVRCTAAAQKCECRLTQLGIRAFSAKLHTVQELQFRQQSGQRNPEAPRYQLNIDDANVPVTPFDVGQIAAVQAQPLSKHYLCPAVF
jgi:hypothetical protein